MQTTDDAARDAITRAISEIEGSDDSCSCHIVKSCDTCEKHLGRVKLIADLTELLKDTSDV